MQKKTLFRNPSCRTAKNLLHDHQDIQMNLPKIHNLIGITNDDELTFAIKLGEKVKETSKNPVL